MPYRIGSVIGSYDLFAKTFPGIIFFIGMVSLLPDIPSFPGDDIGVGGITIVLIVTAVSGFVIGQALHSIAVAIETFCYKGVVVIYKRAEWLGGQYWRKREGYAHSASNLANSKYEKTWIRKYGLLLVCTIIRGPFMIYCWLVETVHAIVIPHRVMFKYRLEKEFEDKGYPDGLYDWFKIQSLDHLKSMNADLVKEYEKVYRFVMSYLDIAKVGRARKFQATSSFCRSIWITLVIFAVIYTSLLLLEPSYHIGFEPVIMDTLDDYRWRIPVVLVFSSLPFMYAASQYKKHFIEYIVVDFYNIVGSDANSTHMNIEADSINVDVNN